MVEQIECWVLMLKHCTSESQSHWVEYWESPWRCTWFYDPSTGSLPMTPFISSSKPPSLCTGYELTSMHFSLITIMSLRLQMTIINTWCFGLFLSHELALDSLQWTCDDGFDYTNGGSSDCFMQCGESIHQGFWQILLQVPWDQDHHWPSIFILWYEYL